MDLISKRQIRQYADPEILLLAMIANVAVQSSARTFFTMLSCSLTPPTMLDTEKLID